MSKWPAAWRVILILIFCGILAGCVPISDSPLDEEKDPNFIEGRNHQNAMDYKAAIASFERAVQANPRNAAAHFELGILYQQKMSDPVSAIYHFQKHMEFRPKSEYAELVKQQITSCKLELAKTVSFGVVTAEVHRDMQRLTNELALLRQETNTLRLQLAAKPMVVTQWMTLRVTNTVAPPVQPVTSAQPRVLPTNSAAARPVAPRPAQSQALTNRAPANVRPPASQPRLYQVRPGDTFSQIARRYKISMEKMRAANPSVQPNRIRPGQTLIIPAE